MPNARKLLKNIDKWRKKEREAHYKWREVSERLALARAAYIVYMNQCPYFIEPPDKVNYHYKLANGNYGIYIGEPDIPTIFKEAFNE